MASHQMQLDGFYRATYEELRRLARSVRKRGAPETLNATALVHEAYLKLSRSRGLGSDSRLHFKRIAARAMRQVIVEAARRRNALKRGGDFVFVTHDEALQSAPMRSEQILALDAALIRLHDQSPRRATVVEYRFFGGYSIAETAELLGVSESTVERDWRAARAWLAMQLRSS